MRPKRHASQLTPSLYNHHCQFQSLTKLCHLLSVPKLPCHCATYQLLLHAITLLLSFIRLRSPGFLVGPQIFPYDREATPGTATRPARRIVLPATDAEQSKKISKNQVCQIILHSRQILKSSSGVHSAIICKTIRGSAALFCIFNKSICSRKRCRASAFSRCCLHIRYDHCAVPCLKWFATKKS